ncbi:hypothetical protein HJC23_003276 [Cyclotella cryptica]|uniref:Uncharacterized protein n=1 Tax=Cyclotella cryptica TaxID=29204 RepID=A0ABD3QXS5_9STRA|eukprot:CCRYP_000819-RA/>CCRYP_000819-RA protein AED:0.08 eAED:0.08 QI:521/1/1/1/1/1/2/250/966
MAVDAQISPASTPGGSSTYASEETEIDMASHSSSAGRTQRYKVAMTARARQRRMRRMKEKITDDSANEEESCGSAAECDSPARAGMTPAVGNGTRRKVPQSPVGRSPAREMNVVTPDGYKKQTQQQQQTPQSALKSRYERSLTASRLRSNSKSRASRNTPTANSVSAVDGLTTKAAPKRTTVQTIQNNHSMSSTSTNKFTHTAPKKSPAAESIHQDFLPTLTAGLSPDEVRDAANFTSIQFQCSNISGEVEMFSGDEFGSPGNDSARSDNTSGGHSTNYFQNEVWSEATTPSLLLRGDIFHHKAAASIVSLLTPDRMFEAGLMAPETSGNSALCEDDCPPDVNGDSPTGVWSSPGGLTFDHDDPGMFRGGEWRGVEQVKDGAAPKGKEEVVRRALTTRMIPPSKQLADLLSQIRRDENVTPEINRAYSTRRKNACGALKILSAKEENRLKICWTTGVLTAIASVLADVKAVTTDNLAFNANTEARNRIVSTLLNLSVNKKNRMLICNTPGVLEAITKTIAADDGESRQGCCTVLLYLAKTSETRPLIIRCPGLLDTLSNVIDVTHKSSRQPTGGSPRKTYQNRFLKKFKSPRNSERVVGDGGGSPASPKETDHTEEMMHSHEETLSNTEDDSSSVSSDSTSTGTGSITHGSHTDEDSEGSATEEHTDEEENSEDDETQEDKGSKVKKKKSVVIEQMPKMEICFKTPLSVDEGEKQDDLDYDADPNRFLHGARLSIFACLLCLVKNMENAFDIARSESLVNALISVSKMHKSPSHPRAIAILAHLTRHPKNCHHLVFKYLTLLPMLQNATGSDDTEARKYALCALQNLSMDKSCRAPIGHTPKMISSLTERCNSENKDEVLAAVASLQNLSDEPANLIQFTIVKNCIGTIISIAESDKARMLDGVETDLTQFMAKNALATISFWFRKIATSGSQRMLCDSKVGGGSPGATVPLYDAVLKPTGYNQWS